MVRRPSRQEMPRPFFDRLMEYYSDVGKVLRGEASAASIFPNPSDIGSSRERVYAEVLKMHLPSSCNVVFGGFLFDQNGSESKQIDILITNESSLRFDFHNRDGTGKSFACIDGCVGLVSVKSTLNSSELIDSLENIASIPDKQLLPDTQVITGLTLPEYDDWPCKIIYASDGVKLPTLQKSLNSFYVDNPEIPFHKRPNVIHVAGKYAIVRSKMYSIGPSGETSEPGRFHGAADNTDAFGLLTAIMYIQETALGSKYVLYCYRKMLTNAFRQSSTWRPDHD
jgi:hypothetical protein